ncbi:hypothetical protein EIK77_004562 [Talaromyces pinophilus]|jgi:mitogen-activated protein kinase kinase|nr:hypothetical protein EIK77_004562 [Talaromyces pinophilus]
MADAFKPRTMKRKNVKGLALNATPKPASTPSEGDAQVPGAVGNTESTRSDTLEIGLEFKLDLRSEDLVTLKEVGAGNGGTVAKVMHATTKVVMARKVGYPIWLDKFTSDTEFLDYPRRRERERPQANPP